MNYLVKIYINMLEERETEILNQLKIYKKFEDDDNAVNAKSPYLLSSHHTTYDWTIHRMRKRNYELELKDIRWRREITQEQWEEIVNRRERVENILKEVSKNNLDIGKYIDWLKPIFNTLRT